MYYHCKHYGKQIDKYKALKFCLKSDCWALKLFKNKGQCDKYLKKVK